VNSQGPPHRGHGQGNGYSNTNEWSSGSGTRSHLAASTSGPEKMPEEIQALEQARLERELLEKKRQEDALKREAAEKERLRIEEEKRQQAALIDLQRRQEIIQTHLTKAEEKWERVRLPPSVPPPKPTTPRFVVNRTYHLFIPISHLVLDLLILQKLIEAKDFNSLLLSLLKTNLHSIKELNLPLIPRPPQPHLLILKSLTNERFFILQSIFMIQSQAVWSSLHIFRKLLNDLIVEDMMKFMREQELIQTNPMSM
jgi:hypothetical protein